MFLLFVFLAHLKKILQLEVAMANKFESMKGELDEVECSDHIPLPTSYMEKWRILLWTKAL